jgi:hypothetical protein
MEKKRMKERRGEDRRGKERKGKEGKEDWSLSIPFQAIPPVT